MLRIIYAPIVVLSLVGCGDSAKTGGQPRLADPNGDSRLDFQKMNDGGQKQGPAPKERQKRGGADPS